VYVRESRHIEPMGRDSMTDDEFYGRVRQCGVKPTPVRGVWVSNTDPTDFVNVPSPAPADDDEKESFLENLRKKRGLGGG